MRHCQACRGTCQKCALPQTSTVCGHFMPQVGAAREEGQEDQALIDSAGAFCGMSSGWEWVTCKCSDYTKLCEVRR